MSKLKIRGRSRSEAIPVYHDLLNGLTYQVPEDRFLFKAFFPFLALFMLTTWRLDSRHFKPLTLPLETPSKPIAIHDDTKSQTKPEPSNPSSSQKAAIIYNQGPSKLSLASKSSTIGSPAPKPANIVESPPDAQEITPPGYLEFTINQGTETVQKLVKDLGL